jgi:hypothetical protein
MKIRNLQKALNSFLKNEDADKLAPILAEALKARTVSYEKAGELNGEDAEDILTLAYGWRLLLPVRASKAGDWEDRMLIPRPGETYEMPNVVKYLVIEAVRTGNWDPEKAIIEVFRSIEEPDLDKMVALIEGIASKIKGHRIIGSKIKKVCNDLDLVDRVDPLVSELKACGILSHKLGAITEAGRIGSPIYEINPSLLVGGHR